MARRGEYDNCEYCIDETMLKDVWEWRFYKKGLQYGVPLGRAEAKSALDAFGDVLSAINAFRRANPDWDEADGCLSSG